MPSGKLKTGAIILILSLLLIWLAWPIFKPNTSPTLPHQYHGQLTGEDATSDSTEFDVGGTDLGIIVKHNGEYLYFFGDTFSFPSMTGNWRSNTVAITDDAEPSDGISIDSWILDPTSGNAKELISSLKIDNVEMTCIPTTAVSLEGVIYVYYMSVRHWSDIGGDWTCNNASIAFSLDDGQTFTKATNMSWDGDSNFIQFGVVQPFSDSDDYIYLLSTPSGRFGSCYLSRVAPENILNISSYEYYTETSTLNEPIWSTNEEDAALVFSAPVGEVSVMWNEYLEKWTAFYTDNIAFSIVLRTADYLWGPWSDEVTIVDDSEYPYLYGSFIHPDLVENDGETVYFIMSIFTQYNTFVMSVDLGSLAS